MRPGGDNRFGRVAVLMGGQSAEREISLKSGGQVLQALQARGVDAHGVDVDATLFSRLQQGEFDRVFLILHGRGGEDGVLQAVLETLQIPYTGSGVLASALAMDKHRSKLIWRALGLPTADWLMLTSAEQAEQAVQAFGLPMIIKPTQEGSSVGVTKLVQAEQAAAAWQSAAQYGPVMAERFIHGPEYTCGILDGQALPLVRMSTPRDFYDYQAKYFADDTEYFCPCGLSPVLEQQIQTMSLQAFDALGGRGWGRIDWLMDQQQQAWLLEANTAPGMTDHSLVPMAAKQIGLDFGDLVVRILETTLDQTGHV